MYRNVKRPVFLLVCLVLIGLATGCLPVSQAEESPTTTPCPTRSLTGIVQIGQPKELAQATERLSNSGTSSLWLSNLQINGDVLLATVGRGEDIHPVAISLHSGEAVGLDSPLIASSRWMTVERYFAWTASDVPDDPARSLHVYDIHTGEEFTVEGEGLSQCCADVSGNIVVWSEIHAGRGGDIYAYDVSSHELIPVVTRPLFQGRPKIKGDWIIYLEDKHSDDPRNPMRDLYLHNLATGEDMRIGPSPYASDGSTYGIADGQVFWIGWNIGQEPTKEEGPLPAWHIYDLNTRQEKVMDTSSAACPPGGFGLGGDMMKWACGLERYAGYDLEQGVFFEFPILPEEMRGKVESWEAFISNEWVVWYIVERRERVWDYMTPGASPMPPEEHWLTPQPRQYRLFVVPITR